jgi:hypothetical protein
MYFRYRISNNRALQVEKDKIVSRKSDNKSTWPISDAELTVLAKLAHQELHHFGEATEPYRDAAPL